MIAFAATLKHAQKLPALEGFPVYPRWDLAQAAAQSTPRR